MKSIDLFKVFGFALNTSGQNFKLIIHYLMLLKILNVMKNKYLLLAFIVSVLFAACEKELKEYDEPTGRIFGKVIDKVSGKGLKDIFVVFEKVQNGTLHGTMSKQDGSFSFGALSSGEYKIFGIQDTMRMGGDTLRMNVNDGQSVGLTEELVMEPAGMPQPGVPQLIAKTRNSVTLKVPYESNGSVVTGYGFFYTSDGTAPTIKSVRKGASVYYDVIRKDYYEVVISGLLANTTYRFVSYLYVKNKTSLMVGTSNTVLSDTDLSVTTDAVQ